VDYIASQGDFVIDALRHGALRPTFKTGRPRRPKITYRSCNSLGTPAPSPWFLVLGLGVLLPILLG